jgi:hypothetical protein
MKPPRFLSLLGFTFLFFGLNFQARARPPAAYEPQAGDVIFLDREMITPRHLSEASQLQLVLEQLP